MQTLEDNQFTVESREKSRKIAGNLQVSWKKEIDPTISFFTIGVSTIGGVDIIKGAQGSPSEWNQYLFSDESSYLLSMDWERGLNMPRGGIRKALFRALLDNTSGRFLPDYMGGNSELYTAVLPRRPVNIQAGFNYNGIDNLIPQLMGIADGTPRVNSRRKTLELRGSDFMDFLNNRYVDETTMWTGLRADEVIEDLLSTLGYSTAQYELDPGIQVIPFGVFPKGVKWINIINELVQAEYGHFYQDEEGRLRFENRSHWGSSPHTEIQRILLTSDVLNAESIAENNIVNVVEVRSTPRQKETEQYLFVLQAPVLLESGDNELFVDYEDPVLEVSGQTLSANNRPDGGGRDRTSSVTVNKRTDFAESSKYVLTNALSRKVWLTDFSVTGRPARVKESIYVRKKDDSSITAFEERVLEINNDYIQSEDWANSIAQQILTDYAEPENLVRLTIRAMPEIQLGDLLSWQGNYYRVFNIETTLDPGEGFVQTLDLLRKPDALTLYFRIGISTIEGSDKIAP